MKRVAALLVPAAALLFAACAGAPPATAPVEPGAVVPPAAGGDETLPPPGAAPFATLATRFTARAVKQERTGDLHQALNSWKVVAALRPETAEPKRRVAELSKRVAADAERHFRDGNTRLQEGNADAARREFLLSLAADPGHAGALDALMNRIEPEATPYTVADGDTFEEIAKKQYGDPAKAPIVALVNKLDPGGKPTPGAILTLPSLAPPTAKPTGKRTPEAVVETPEALDSGYDTEPSTLGTEGPTTAEPSAPAEPATPVEPVKAPDPAEAQLAKAKELFQAKKFEDAGSAADKLAGNPAVGARARELSGDAWFAAGDAALKEERFADAVAAYRKAGPARKDATAALAAVERRKKEKAEESYNEGVRFFINQQLDEAIRSWEQTLALNPEHQKAARDIAKARGLQQKLKELR